MDDLQPITRVWVGKAPKKIPKKLTKRHREVLDARARGLTAPEIGKELGLAVATVNGHLKRGRKAGNIPSGDAFLKHHFGEIDATQLEKIRDHFALTKGQMIVVEAVLKGLSPRERLEITGLSDDAFKMRMHKAYEKIGVHSHAALFDSVHKFLREQQDHAPEAAFSVQIPWAQLRQLTPYVAETLKMVLQGYELEGIAVARKKSERAIREHFTKFSSVFQASNIEQFLFEAYGDVQKEQLQMIEERYQLDPDEAKVLESLLKGEKPEECKERLKLAEKDYSDPCKRIILKINSHQETSRLVSGVSGIFYEVHRSLHLSNPTVHHPLEFRL